MIREPLRRRGRRHQGITRLAETERPGRTVVTVSEQVTDNGHSALAVELSRLRAENARLLRLLNLTRQEAAPPGPWQSGLFEAPPGLVHADSAPEAKVALFGALFATRTDVYAVRWENTRTGKAGWLPAVRGGWRKGRGRCGSRRRWRCPGPESVRTPGRSSPGRSGSGPGGVVVRVVGVGGAQGFEGVLDGAAPG
jgi:hypothetical protein